MVRVVAERRAEMVARYTGEIVVGPGASVAARVRAARAGEGVGRARVGAAKAAK